MLQVWEYETTAGATVRGAMAGFSDFGGGDVVYRFHRLDDAGRVMTFPGDGRMTDSLGGARLKAARRIGAMEVGGAFEGDAQ
jgi:hypothetical protein